MSRNFKTYFSALALVIASHCGSNAQEFVAPSKFENGNVKILWRATSVKPGHDGSYGGWTLNIGLSQNEKDLWGKRTRYENPTLGDMFFVLARMINGKSLKTESGLEHSFGAGFFGWFQRYVNAYVSEKLIISPGFSIGDYIYGLQHFDSSNQIKLYDPAGYFFHAGPGVLASYSLGNDFWLDGYINYDIAFARAQAMATEAIEGYKKPHFVSVGFDVHHRSPLYAGIRLNQSIDRGGNKSNAKRLDVSVGVYLGKRR